MGRKILLNLLLQTLKAALGNVNIQDLLSKFLEATLANGQPAKVVMSEDSFKVVDVDGKEVDGPVTLKIKLD